jgi:D-3-phosphoglycerate dehydrogenase
MDGVLLIFTHQDVPGIIGRVGTIFGAHRINIAQMAVGRSTAGGSAIGVLNLDQEPTEAALAEVLSAPDIHTARVIRLPPAGKLPPWLQG